MSANTPSDNEFEQNITPENHLKFNEIMPESDENVLCVKVTKPISLAGYTKNFIPRIEKMIADKGRIRLLVYYKDHKGWEPAAAEQDLSALFRYGDKLEKVAILNPSTHEIKSVKLKQPLTKAQIKFFNEEDLDKALEWVKS